MGRKVVVKSEAEIAEQKARNAARRNARRTAAYQADPDYRAKVVQASRVQYRKNNGVAEIDCRSNLANLADFGTVRWIEIAGEQTTAVTFDVREVAAAFGGYNAHLMYRWQANGQLPYAVVEVVDTQGLRKVFTLNEMAAMIQVLGQHQTQVRNYRRDHAETVHRMFAAVEGVRQALKITS